MKKLTSAVILVVLTSLTAINANAQPNLLTAGDFEGLTSLDIFWASDTGLWGAENAGLTGATGGVTPFGSQMLQVNHAGGGSVSQVHQMVEGPFITGTEVTFEAELNVSSSHTGVSAFISISRRECKACPDLDRISSTELVLDSDANTWQTFSVTHILSSEYNFVSAEILFRHNAALAASPGFADNAVLTAVAPPPPDADGDGVADVDDVCDNSIITSTVEINGLPSDVPNYVDAQGCTVADRLDIACSGDFKNHGQFVSCVAHVAEDAVLDGLLTEEEAEDLVSAAARSGVAKPPKAGKKK